LLKVGFFGDLFVLCRASDYFRRRYALSLEFVFSGDGFKEPLSPRVSPVVTDVILLTEYFINQGRRAPAIFHFAAIFVRSQEEFENIEIGSICF
jgi:hypothetical protein